MASISPRAIADLSTEFAPAERIRAIANKVRRPAKFAEAQRAYHDLSERYTALREEERGLIQRMLAAGGETANGSAPLIRRIRECDAELSTCSDSIREALAKLFEAREPFAASIAAALQPERAAAARRALAAAMALCSELDLLDSINHEISSIGGQPGQHPLPQFRASLEPMLGRLRRIAVE
jgi:hypothetical protein